MDYELYARIIGTARDLNNYEQKLFKSKRVRTPTSNLICIESNVSDSTYFTRLNNRMDQINSYFVNNIMDFQNNFTSRFIASAWLETIDFQTFTIVGSCVLNALSRSSLINTEYQDANLIYPARNGLEFDAAVMNVITKLYNITPGHLKLQLSIEKIPGSAHYYISLPSGIKLNIMCIPASNSKNPLSHIFHNFDMDIAQVVFDGIVEF